MLKQKYRDVCEKLEWAVHEADDGIDLEKYSPAGEDFYISGVAAETFVEDIVDYAESFDTEEHAAMWIEAKRNRTTSGIPSIRELVDDADAIQEMLNELAEELQKAEATTDDKE